jgi:DNA-binding response OmpR family regulator
MEGLDIRADDYVIKPFDSREVLVQVKTLITLRRDLLARWGQQFTLGPSTIEVTTLDERCCHAMNADSPLELFE